jgi:glycerol-3-phosphate dehydrogenase
MRFDVVIVGAGVVGLCHRTRADALPAGRRPHRTRVRGGVRDQQGQQRHHPRRPPRRGRHRKGATEWRGNQLWDDSPASCRSASQRIGDLTVAFDEDDVATWHELLEQGQRRGVPGLELWDAERCGARSPTCRTTSSPALHAPTAAS